MTKKVIIIVSILIILFIAGSLIKQISATVASSERLIGLINEVAELKIKNRELYSQIERIKTKEFIEEQARNKLGLIKDGETLVIISDDKLKQVMGVSQSAQVARLPNWKGWLRLFW
jgi:cell division protein FtsB